MSNFEGSTVEEAIQKGLTQLGLSREEVEVEVVEEAKKGFLGLGKKTAKVKMTAKQPTTKAESVSQASVEASVEASSEQTNFEEKVSSQKTSPETTASQEKEKILENLSDEEALTELALYLTNISNELGAPALVRMERNENMIVFHLDSNKQGMLIGKHGKILNAIQYLAQVFIHRVAENKLSVVVNVGDYREKRQAILERLAERTADKVERTGRPVFLEPMPAFERKQIHSALSKSDAVQTHSEGEEPYRYLVVEPAKKFY